MRLLIVTSKDYEARAILREFTVSHSRVGPYLAASSSSEAASFTVIAGGPGSLAAATATATALALDSPYDLVVSAGIGGGYRGRAEIGNLVVATDMVAAEPRMPQGDVYHVKCSDSFVGEARKRLDPVVGTILTVWTATGSESAAEELMQRHPGAVAEALEGAGVATAAKLFGIHVAEIRSISNLVGRWDKTLWDKPVALESLSAAFAALLARAFPY